MEHYATSMAYTTRDNLVMGCRCGYVVMAVSHYASGAFAEHIAEAKAKEPERQSIPTWDQVEAMVRSLGVRPMAE